MTQVHSFGVDAITCFAWNADRTNLAISQNSNDVQICKSGGGDSWTTLDTLAEHGQRVTGIDWAPNSNRIVTCASDRNAYVWTMQPDRKWKPTLVLLRINRAATCVKWSPLENKFAVGSGARLVSICYFEEEPNWWVSKHIKKPIRSTVTCLDWHPNNIILACGSTDFKARVFSAYVKEVDSKGEAASVWGKKPTFGNVMAEFSNGAGGWVHAINFSANGDRVAWVGHDSSISVADATKSLEVAVTLKTSFLPFVACTWVTENSIVVAGYDCCPMLFSFDGGKVEFVSKLDDSSGKSSASKFSAKDHFKTLDSKAMTAEENVTVLNTLHQNTITQLAIYAGTKAKCTKYTTSGVDGQLINWDFKGGK